jgi:hypothetical protein
LFESLNQSELRRPLRSGLRDTNLANGAHDLHSYTEHHGNSAQAKDCAAGQSCDRSKINKIDVVTASTTNDMH